MQGRRPIGIFHPRQCDFQKNKKPDQPLRKDGARLVQTDAPVHQGNDCYGTFHIVSSKDKPATLFYAAYHHLDEYLAIEILQLLGINTPKVRMLVGTFPTTQRIRPLLKTHGNIVSKGFTDYIPMFFLREKLKHHFKSEPDNPRYRYYIDLETQTVLDMQTDKHLRIAGNAFSYQIASMLIHDTDFQENDFNFGMIRVGNRFYAATIDKEVASFTKPELDQMSVWLRGSLQKNAAEDQQLVIIQAIVTALKVTDDEQCDFDRIFTYSRLNATPELCRKRQQHLTNLKARAHNLVAYFLKDDSSRLEKFAQREKVRERVANHVVTDLVLPDHIKAEELKAIIIEDLRGPYYKHLFKNGMQISRDDCYDQGLHDAIVKDVLEEFELELRQSNTLKI